jgi:hypothetical protein
MKTISYVYFSLLAIIGEGFLAPTFAGEGANWRQNHPEWIWCDDFDSSDTNLNHRYEDVSTNGMSIVSDESFEGGKCLRQHYIPGQVDAGWICKVNNLGYPDHLFMRWYHKFEAGFQGFPPKMARTRYRNRTTWVSTFIVHSWIETDGVLALDVQAPSSSQANSVGWLAIARSKFSFANSANIGRWVCFEMEVQLNTPGAADGLYRLWADDSLVAERTSVDLRGNTTEKINETMLDCYWNGGSLKAQNRYYDNFVVSTKRIGMYKKAGVLYRPQKISGTTSFSIYRPAIKLQYKNWPASPGVVISSNSGQGNELLYNLLGKRIGMAEGK